MEGKKNLCAMIPAELHAKIMAEKEQLELNTLAEYVERITRDGHAKNFKYEELDPRYFIHSEGAALVHYLEAINIDLADRDK